MNIKNLEKALLSFVPADSLVAELAQILSLCFRSERARYQELAAVCYGGLDEALLTLWEWKLVIPVRSCQCAEWDSRILMTEPGEFFEMPNISKTLIKHGMETGRWDSASAILDLFHHMGEPEWEKMPTLIRSIKRNSQYNTINGAKIGALCAQNGLHDKTGAMIAILKGAGVISPKLAAIRQVATSRSPLYEFNPSVYAEVL